MSNAAYPTLNQVLPCYLSMLKKLNKYLMCASIAVEPNYPSLRMYGKAEEICRGVNLARKKFQKYYELAKQIPLIRIATGIFFPFFCITNPLTFFSLKYWTLDLNWTITWKLGGLEIRSRTQGNVWNRCGRRCTSRAAVHNLYLIMAKKTLQNYCGPISVVAR